MNEPIDTAGTSYVSRRALLRASLGLAGAALLAACGGNATPTTAGGTGGSGGSIGLASGTAVATRPVGTVGVVSGTATVSPTAGAGRIKATLEGVPDAITAVPASYPQSYRGTPTAGGKITTFTIAY